MSGECTCGYGGFHDDINPRCRRNMTPAVASIADDAARLRSLAATFDSHYNRVKTYTGAQVAAMLRDGGE